MFHIRKVEDLKLQHFIHTSYNICIKWFGMPSDGDWPVLLIRDKKVRCTKIINGKYYIVSTSIEYTHHYQDLASISHEMYHRVTNNCKGLRESIWVDEMLAYLASKEILIQLGLIEYANQRDGIVSGCNYKLNLESLKKHKANRCLIFHKSKPKGFYEGVSCLGNELRNHVNWSQICKLVHCSDWNEWLDCIPIEKRIIVKKLLNV